MTTLTATEAIEQMERVAHRDRAEKEASDNLTKARTRLVLAADAPSAFFASLAMRLKSRPDWSIGTAGTDGVWLVYDPDFINGLTDKERIGVLCHEVMHCAHQHFARENGRERKLFNVACDLAINHLIKEAGMSLPKEGCFAGEGKFKDYAKGLSAEEYYTQLQNDNFDTSCFDGDDPGACGGILKPGTGDGQGEPMEAADVRTLEQDWKSNVAAASQAAKGRGQQPGWMERLCGDLLAPKVNWKEQLRSFMTSRAKRDYSWSRPAKRHLPHGVYLPSITGNEIGHVAIAIDTSGSVDDATLQRFASEVNDIAQQGVCKLSVAYHHVDIYRVDEFNPQEQPFEVGQVISGGTDHSWMPDFIERLDEPPVLMICLTDAFTSFPRRAPECPTLWAIVGNPDPKVPFGEVIQVEE